MSNWPDRSAIETEKELVRQLGERIGYGNMMHLASILWQESLESRGYPITGAFVPALLTDLKKRIMKRYTVYRNVKKWLEK